jgi:hypothetical protein
MTRQIGLVCRQTVRLLDQLAERDGTGDETVRKKSDVDLPTRRRLDRDTLERGQPVGFTVRLVRLAHAAS